MSVLIQGLLNRLFKSVVESNYNNSKNRITKRIYFKLYKLIRDYFDPLIKYNINGFYLHLRYSHKLPFYLKQFPYYSSNIGRIAIHVKQEYTDLTFIDIGANIGDSISFLRNHEKFPILSIEGDERFFSILKKNVLTFSDVTISKTFLSSDNLESKAKIFTNYGTSRLEEDYNKGEIIQFKTLDALLNDYPSFKKSKMIKFDTDGYDAQIIRGSRNIIDNIKPVLFFEYQPYFYNKQNYDCLSIFSFLLEYGYRSIMIYDNFGMYMFSSDLSDLLFLSDLSQYSLRSKGKYYYDICAFHSEDHDLFERVRYSEVNFFNNRIYNTYPL